MFDKINRVKRESKDGEKERIAGGREEGGARSARLSVRVGENWGRG